MDNRVALDLRLAACEARFAHDVGDGAGPLRVVAEEAARERVGASPAGGVVMAIRSAVEAGVARDAALEAAAFLARAEEVTVVLGYMATSAAEGIHSRADLCNLKLARAWLHLAANDGEASLETARRLAAEVESESNGVGARLARPIEALRKALKERASRAK